MIIRTEDWTRRNPLCKQYGWRAAIVYEQKAIPGQAPASYQRLRVKEWAYMRWGKPAHIYGDQIYNPTSEWFVGQLKTEEYVIAFRSKPLRDWALLL